MTFSVNIKTQLIEKKLGESGVSELMDGRGCAILALELVPKNLIFAQKSYPKIYFTRFYACHFSKENWREPPVLYLTNDFYACS